MTAIAIRPIVDADRAWLRQFMIDQWGDEIMVMHGEILRPHEHAGFLTQLDGQVAGIVTYRLAGGACEVLSLDSLCEGVGVGTALIDAVVETAKRAGCARLWLITTNDNLNALRFYQKRGFALVAVHRDAMTRARVLKPSIPPVGDHGIAIRDEIELEMAL